MRLGIPKSASRWSTGRQEKNHQDSCWSDLCKIPSDLKSVCHIHPGDLSSTCHQAVQGNGFSITSWNTPEDFLQCSSTAQGCREWQQNKTQSISGHFRVKGKVSGGCYCSWSDSPPGISYPWKLLQFRDCRADELYHSSCNLSGHLTSRILLLPVMLNFSDFIIQLLALVAFLLTRLKIFI